VVVVEKLGGSRSSQSFKDANLAYGDLVGERLPLTPVPADLDSIRDALLAEYPYATAVIKTLLADLITAKHVRFKPTLLVSPPGLGKSRLCRSVSDLLRVPMARYDGASSLDNMFGGVTRSWHGSMPCFPFLALVAPHKRADGIVMIDEIDKASTRIQNGTLANALLPFLEGETAQRIADPYLLHPIDLSNVSYLLTANDELLVPPPLRDRLRVLRIPEPTADHLVPLARGIVRDVAKASGEDVRFLPDLDADEIDIAQSLWRGGSVRRLKRIVELILGHRERSARN
jgi:ATP-dependent Lon protease